MTSCPQDLSITLVDDSPSDREIVKYYLRENGYRIDYEFTSYADVLAHKEKILKTSCILLDYSLPDANGTEVLQSLASGSNAPPILMLTGYKDEKIVIDCMKSGAMDYIVKDYISAEGLKRAIMNGIEKQVVHSQLARRAEEAHHFATVLAHDLKSSLRIVTIASNNALEAVESPADNRELLSEHLGYVTKNAKHLTDIIDGLLAYIQYDSNYKYHVPVDISKVIYQVHHNLKHKFDMTHVNIVSEGTMKITGDRNSIELLFQNVIENAIKYNDKEKKNIVISCEDNRDHALLTIKDNGIGIEEKYYDDIFQPMMRLHTKDEIEGAGIGLALVKKIMTQHKGRCSVSSELGSGTTFTMTFPKVC